MQQVQTYRERSRSFLTKAWEELDAGNLEQASEKAWGATAMIVKAAAEERGLAHHTHRDYYPVLRAMVQQTGDEGLRDLFRAANELHHNFYEHWLTSEEVSSDIDSVERFVEKVEQLIPPTNG